MLTPMTLEDEPQLQMFNGCQVFTQHSAFLNPHREAKHRGGVRLHHTRFRREPLLLQECSKRVFIVRSHTADVKATMLRMDTTSRPCELRNSSFGLNTSDSSTTIDANIVSEFSVCSNSNILQLLKAFRKVKVVRRV